MNTVFLVFRFLHVLLGVFWVGAAIFMAAFLQPAIRDTGPDGAKVMAALAHRGLLHVMPVVAIVTVLSGGYLLWIVSGAFKAAYFTTPRGMTYGIGAVAALIAIGLGFFVLRPALDRAAALTARAANATGPDREQALGGARALRLRAASAGLVVAWLLAAATAAMAIARYV